MAPGMNSIKRSELIPEVPGRMRAWHSSTCSRADSISPLRNSAKHSPFVPATSMRKMVAVNPDASEEASALGTALANLGDKAGAAEQFARARELSNRELTLLRAKGDSNWGISLRNEGKLQEAAAAFQRAIEDDPTFCDAHDDLGEVLWMQKDLAGALQ